MFKMIDGEIFFYYNLKTNTEGTEKKERILIKNNFKFISTLVKAHFVKSDDLSITCSNSANDKLPSSSKSASSIKF